MVASCSIDGLDDAETSRAAARELATLHIHKNSPKSLDRRAQSRARGTSPIPLNIATQTIARARRFEVSAHAKNVLDAKTCLPTLWYAFDAGCKIALSGDGAGGVALRVDNKGGKVFEAATAAGGLGAFLQKCDLDTAVSLCDLSNKYRAALFGPDAQYRDDFVPSELSPFLDFERAYPAAAKALKKGAVLALDKVHGSTLTVGGSASPVQAATLAEVFEAANRLC